MDEITRRLKENPCASSSNIIQTKPKTSVLKRTFKSGNQLKKERKKLTKTKSNKDVSHDDSNEEEPNRKKRKLETDSAEEPLKPYFLNSENEKIKVACTWKDEVYLAESENLTIPIAKNIIELFNKENTIPFITRYRGHLTGYLTPDKLRKVKATIDYIELVHKKAEHLLKQVPPNDSTPELVTCIQSARTVEDLEFIGSAFKKQDSRSLAQRAKKLGLEPPAKSLMEGIGKVSLQEFVKPSVSGLEDVSKVKLGIQHIIADNISKSPDVHNLLEKIYSGGQVSLKSKFKKGVEQTSSKYKLYGDFSQPINMIKPHQTLAINRGEAENELTVKIVIPDFIWLPVKSFCNKKWLKSGSNYELRTSVFSDSVNDAIKRLLGPLVIRRIRGKLNEEAENEALTVFGTNLRQLLMTPPHSGHVVMGIDPGFKNGCKVAVVSPTGELLAYDKFFLNSETEARVKLRNLVVEYRCDTVALGNGKGCRETEVMLSSLIKKKVFKPFNLSYTIINEQGVSIYSCSAIAGEEFPGKDSKVISAVSLARRLQNPLSELVKVEPKHLGVGMYQHDVGEKRLETTLDDIVSECVSFVGVDINSASLYLLKRVAGLSTSKAQEIIKYRNEVCSFKCREDLLKVKGIKSKTFQQCAGFIRIIPTTARCTKHTDCQGKFNPLDETCIHPESYQAAKTIINRFGLNLEHLGSKNFVEAIVREKQSALTEELATICNCSAMEVEFIIESLSKAKNFDLRSLSPGPIFRKEIINLKDLFPGQLLQGVVRNVVNFGAFVDVGVGQDGLIHVSRMKNTTLQLNTIVQAKVVSTCLKPTKIELELVSVVQ